MRVTQQLYSKGYIRGLFLSSGTGPSSVETFIKMGEVAKRLKKRGFKGYIHLKVLPYVPLDIVDYYARYASRVSYNLEAPSEDILQVLSKDKSLKYGFKVLSRFKGSTQFVVDYGVDRDKEYLIAMKRLFELGVKRVYFKAFVPIKDTPMEVLRPGSKSREHHLYQASFLVQRYGFSPEDLLEGDSLPETSDLKLYWAMKNREFFPVEITKASYEDLLKVPGIGPRTAKRILRFLRRNELTEEGLKKLLPSVRKSLPFILFRGRRIWEDGDTFSMLPLFSETGAECL